MPATEAEPEFEIETIPEELEKYFKFAKVLWWWWKRGAKLRVACNEVGMTKQWFKAVVTGTIFYII